MESKLKYHFSQDDSAVGVQSELYQRYTVDRGINSSGSVQFLVEGQEDTHTSPPSRAFPEDHLDPFRSQHTFDPLVLLLVLVVVELDAEWHWIQRLDLGEEMED